MRYMIGYPIPFILMHYCVGIEDSVGGTWTFVVTGWLIVEFLARRWTYKALDEIAGGVDDGRAETITRLQNEAKLGQIQSKHVANMQMASYRAKAELQREILTAKNRQLKAELKAR